MYVCMMDHVGGGRMKVCLSMLAIEPPLFPAWPDIGRVFYTSNDSLMNNCMALHIIIAYANFFFFFLMPSVQLVA